MVYQAEQHVRPYVDLESIDMRTNTLLIVLTDPTDALVHTIN